MKVFWKDQQNKNIGGGTTSESIIRGYQTPTQLLDFGNSLIKYVARDRAHKIESRPLFENVPEGYQTILEQSEWSKLRKRLAMKASELGKVYLLQVPTKEANKPVIGLFRITRYDAIGALPTLVELDSEKLYVKDNQEYNITYRICWNDSQEAIMERYYLDEEGEKVFIDEKESYNWGNLKRLPGQKFDANATGFDDFTAAGVFGSIDHLNFHSNELTTEWKHVLTRITNNENFSDHTELELAKKYANGDRVIKGSSYNNKLQEGQTITSSGSQSITFNQLNINFIEDKILKYVGVMRDSTATGSNKHSLEITLQNQFATEVLMDLRDLREQDYKMFFKSLAETTGLDDISKDVELRVSVIEEAKIALLQESVEQAKNKGSMNQKRTKEEK